MCVCPAASSIQPVIVNSHQGVHASYKGNSIGLLTFAVIRQAGGTDVRHYCVLCLIQKGLIIRPEMSACL